MQYSQYNVTVSIFDALAQQFNSLGYNVRWFSTGDVDETSEYEVKGTITLTRSMPANPAFVVQLKDGEEPEPEMVPVPCFTLLVGPRRQIRRLGLGDSSFEWERPVVIAGLADNELQQMAFTDMLDEWLTGGNKYLSVFDHENAVDPDSPEEMPKLFVSRSKSTPNEVEHEVPAIRYIVRNQFVVRYAE